MFKTVLLAIDVNDGKSTEKAARAAVMLAGAEHAKLHVLNVLPGPGMAMVGAYLGPDHAKTMRDEARKAFEAWAEETLPADIDAELHLAQGTIYDEIIKAADKLGADAIVVGSHRPELKDYLVGPNAARVVRHSKQSVFVIR